MAAFRRHAFWALLVGAAARVADIAETASRDTVGVAKAAAWLEATGALERDGDRIVGAHGLTRSPTRHTLGIGGRTLHTWCALDAVGIPVALGVTATAATTCPTCGKPLAVRVDRGHPHANNDVALWLPTGPGNHTRDDFCANANLFCSPDHLNTWRRQAGAPTGRVVTLDKIAPLAHTLWADIAPGP